MKEIIINSRKHGQHTVLVDDEDYERVSKWRWSIRLSDRIYYAIRRRYSDGKMIRMHREILGLIDSDITVDHKDHNGLNNTRNNIRAVTLYQNSTNIRSALNSSSKYLGVSRCNRQKQWQVQICKNRVRISLGRFNTEQEAAAAYNEAAIKVHGEFANLNVL